jgi:hypothetical protein
VPLAGAAVDGRHCDQAFRWNSNDEQLMENSMRAPNVIAVVGRIVSIVLVTAVLTSSVYAADAVFSAWATIDTIQAGWVVDRMLVFHNAPMKNPDNCPIVTNGYIINEADPGRQTFYAMLISAVVSKKQVTFVVSGCFEQRPRIVSVAIR